MPNSVYTAYAWYSANEGEGNKTTISEISGNTVKGKIVFENGESPNPVFRFEGTFKTNILETIE
jgi:hypothetical protein